MAMSFLFLGTGSEILKGNSNTDRMCEESKYKIRERERERGRKTERPKERESRETQYTYVRKVHRVLIQKGDAAGI